MKYHSHDLIFVNLEMLIFADSAREKIKFINALYYRLLDLIDIRPTICNRLNTEMLVS
jgi:hypothetical protein